MSIVKYHITLIIVSLIAIIIEPEVLYDDYLISVPEIIDHIPIVFVYPTDVIERSIPQVTPELIPSQIYDNKGYIRAHTTPSNNTFNDENIDISAFPTKDNRTINSASTNSTPTKTSTFIPLPATPTWTLEPTETFIVPVATSTPIFIPTPSVTNTSTPSVTPTNTNRPRRTRTSTPTFTVTSSRTSTSTNTPTQVLTPTPTKANQTIPLPTDNGTIPQPTSTRLPNGTLPDITPGGTLPDFPPGTIPDSNSGVYSDFTNIIGHISFYFRR